MWGRKENVNAFAILETIMEKYGLGPKEKPKKTNFDLGKDPEGLKKELENFGYTNIRMWYQPMNYVLNTFDDYFNIFFG